MRSLLKEADVTIMESRHEVMDRFMNLELADVPEVPGYKSCSNITEVDGKSPIIIPRDKATFYSLFDIYSKGENQNYLIYFSKDKKYWMVDLDGS